MTSGIKDSVKNSDGNNSGTIEVALELPMSISLLIVSGSNKSMEV